MEKGGIERIEKLATDTTVTLEPNKLYIFPEMTSLTYTIAEDAGEVHFIFKSGATKRHGRAPRITTSGSRVCMDGKRCTQTNHWQTPLSAV